MMLGDLPATGGRPYFGLRRPKRKTGGLYRMLIEHFGDKVYRTLIPRNVRVAEAPSYGLPVLRYSPSSRGALAYLGLAGEMLRRNRKRQAG